MSIPSHDVAAQERLGHEGPALQSRFGGGRQWTSSDLDLARRFRMDCACGLDRRPDGIAPCRDARERQLDAGQREPLPVVLLCVEKVDLRDDDRRVAAD